MDPVYKFHESGYAGLANNPVLYADAMGLDTTDPSGNTLPAAEVVDEHPGELPNAAPSNVTPIIPVVPPAPPPVITTTTIGTTAGKVLSRAVALPIVIFALVISPSELGRGSDMPYPTVEFPKPSPEPDQPSSNGYAIVYHHDTDPSPGHFSIEVVVNDQTLHTHQDRIRGVPMSVDMAISQFNWSAESFMLSRFRGVRVNLPNALAAQAFQYSSLGPGNGPYRPYSNDCLTHICNVLREGGAPIPLSGRLQAVKAREIFKKLY